MKPLFVTGIGTDVGKTVISAILVEKLKSDYWKPVQSGDLDRSDTKKVKDLISNTRSVFHPEAYRLTKPFSPHKSAMLDGIQIEPGKIAIPDTENRLLIEGAGGLFVPLNDKYYVIDLISKFEAEVILVVKHYLGSINHTLLSLEVLRSRKLHLKGIVFNGPEDKDSEEAILLYSNTAVLGRVPDLAELSRASIKEAGKYISELF